ncbi:MAG TPA: disulfide oxidoreductase [Candidatus Saccharimonadales bacterium]|nr:disulfide oxidoreductase [Candidatus Saccharimonadales bacterium]
MQKFLKQNVLYIAWAQSLAAVFGSLYFSEIVHFPPCILCWYQRIFMYPLAIIIPIGIIKKDKKIYQYVLPLAIIGAIFGFYHNLLYYGIIPESLTPCLAGISCTTKFIEFFGFVTIPFLSLSAFLVIIACMLLYRKFNLKKGKK